MMEYTEIIDGFQIRDVTYIGLPPKDTQHEFDIVKWMDCEPHKVRDLRTGEWKTMTRYCWSVAFLVWDRHEGWWQFRSVGTRWLEEKPTDSVVNMVLTFCNEKAKELQYETD